MDPDTTGISRRDTMQLEAVEGWLGLGNPHEALVELEKVSPELKDHLLVLNARWQVSAAMRDWDSALIAAQRMVDTCPNRPEGWIHRSYALRRAKSGGLQPAWEALEPAVTKFPNVSTIPYNIACYAAQLGKLSEAWDWLHRAIEAGEDVRTIKEMALRDEDLRALWERIKSI